MDLLLLPDSDPIVVQGVIWGFVYYTILHFPMGGAEMP